MNALKPQAFRAIDQPLLKGVTLIEASAGTGKTFSIAYLVLRLVVEEGVPLQQILTVTFTKAATEELKTRIRAHLTAALRALEHPCADENLMKWVALREANGQMAQDRQRLVAALAVLDLAGIFTIHGFCQRLLREFPLESQQAFNTQLQPDLGDLKAQVVQDFWRKTFYPMPAHRVALMNQVPAISLDGLLSWLNSVAQGPVDLVPEPMPWPDLWQELEAVWPIVQAWTAEALPKIEAWVQAHAPFLMQSAHKALDAFAQNPEPFMQMAGFLKLVSKAQKVWKGQDVQVGREALWADFVAQIGPPTEAFSRLQAMLQSVEPSLKWACLEDYRRQWNLLQQEQGVMGFDELVLRLTQTLAGGHAAMQQAVSARYRAALVDEFQDTDAHQWTLFHTLFGAGAHFLYLIGDPKQAIYRFRGADIQTYLQAAQTAQQRLTLTHNHRSHPALVDAVNAVFSQVDQPFKLAGLDFTPVSAGVKADVQGTPQTPAFEAWLWPLGWAESSADARMHWVLRQVCLDVIQRLKSQEYPPQACAVLVKTHTRAQILQAMLMSQGVPAVIQSRESVFETPQAMSLWRILRAILHPSRNDWAREALNEPLFGIDGPQLFEMFQDLHPQFENWMTALQEAHVTWPLKGLMPAMMGLFERMQVLQVWAGQSSGERRMTNGLHVIEWLQNEALELGLTPVQTFRHLEHWMRAPAQEATQLRLESDADAVQIMTVHASKGLEYPVVYCPDLWREGRPVAQSAVRVKIDGRWCVSASAQGREALKEVYEADLQAEQIRLIYVALTRAKSRLVVMMPPQLSPDADWSEPSGLADLLAEGVPDCAAMIERPLQEEQDDPAPFAIAPALYSRGEKKFNRTLSNVYRLTSFSGLVKKSMADKAERRSEDEGWQGQQTHQDEGFVLPKGAHVGNLLHEVLEAFEFQALVAGLDAVTLTRLCQRYGVLEMLKDGAQVLPQALEAFNALLHASVQSELDGFCLAQLPSDRCMKEMPFYMALKPAQTQELNACFARWGPEIPFQPLEERALEGFLTGYVDLITQVDGRFYVLDYKSNALNNYTCESLHAAMQQANYGFQGVLYTLALHRFLKHRLADYDYQRHMGGVRYLFVRGMRPSAPGEGVYAFCPSRALIEQLEALLGGECDQT